MKNKKWLINLTDYNSAINYSLRNITVGTYLVDIWYKTPLSPNNYDGLKLSLIEVIDEDSSRDLNENTSVSNESTRKQSSVLTNASRYLLFNSH